MTKKYAWDGRQRTPTAIICPLDDIIRRSVLQAMDACSGDVQMTARMLGVGKTTMYRWLREWGWTVALNQSKALGESRR
jgi:transcriptional regulator of acetoin/glycerol metabolism